MHCSLFCMFQHVSNSSKCRRGKWPCQVEELHLLWRRIGLCCWLPRLYLLLCSANIYQDQQATEMRPVWSLDNSLNNLTEQVPVQKFRVYSREVLLLPLNNWQECNELKQEKDFFKEATSIGFDSSWRPVAISFTYKVYFSLPVPKNWISTMSFLPSDNGSMLSLWHTSTICRLYNHRGSTKMRNLEISPWLWWWWQIVAKAMFLRLREIETNLIWSTERIFFKFCC